MHFFAGRQTKNASSRCFIWLEIKSTKKKMARIQWHGSSDAQINGNKQTNTKDQLNRQVKLCNFVLTLFLMAKLINIS